MNKINIALIKAEFRTNQLREKIIARSERDYSNYLYRYMSNFELSLLMEGRTIIGKDFTQKYRTSSKGVCFLGEWIPYHNMLISPKEAYDILRGIVSDNVLVKFGVPEATKIVENWGIYADPAYSWYNPKEIKIVEYTVKKYNIDILSPIEICVPNEWRWKSIENIL